MAILLNKCTHPYIEKGQSEATIKKKIASHDFRLDSVQCSLQAMDLLRKLLNPNPAERISAVEALNHSWLNPKKQFQTSEAKKPVVRNQFISSAANASLVKFHTKAIQLALKTLVIMEYAKRHKPISKLAMFKERLLAINTTASANNSIDGLKTRHCSNTIEKKLKLFGGERSRDSSRDQQQPSAQVSSLVNKVLIERSTLNNTRKSTQGVTLSTELTERPSVKGNMFFKKRSRVLEGDLLRTQQFLRSTQLVNANHVEKLRAQNNEEILVQDTIRDRHHNDSSRQARGNLSMYKNAFDRSKNYNPQKFSRQSIFDSTGRAPLSVERTTNTFQRQQSFRRETSVKQDGNKTIAGSLGDSLGQSRSRTDNSLESKKRKDSPHLVPIFRTTLKDSRAGYYKVERPKLSRPNKTHYQAD
jgi:serine/threonine protein kinase